MVIIVFKLGKAAYQVLLSVQWKENIPTSVHNGEDVFANCAQQRMSTAFFSVTKYQYFAHFFYVSSQSPSPLA
jgi:hypothetical protein